jgi:hypothetical protein
MLFVFDYAADNITAQPLNMTNFSIIRDTTDFIMQGVNLAEYIRWIGDVYSDLFFNALNYVYPIDFCSEFHAKQMIDTLFFTHWQYQFTSTTSAKTADVLEMRHNIPRQLKKKQAGGMPIPGAIFGGAGN